MAFATVIQLEMNLEGNRRLVCGQTTTDSTDGNIETGLSRVDSLLFTHKGSAEEAAAPPFVSEEVLALIPHLALPVSRRSHTGQRAGVGLLQATQSIEEVAPLEATESVRDLVCVSGIQTELNEGADAVHET